MKRMIAGVLLLIGLGAGTMFAEDSYRRERVSATMRRRLRMTAGNGGALSTPGIMRLPSTSDESCGANIAT
jgi:hypothetical protein